LKNRSAIWVHVKDKNNFNILYVGVFAKDLKLKDLRCCVGTAKEVKVS
jgi:hypothetical protein